MQFISNCVFKSVHKKLHFWGNLSIFYYIQPFLSEANNDEEVVWKTFQPSEFNSILLLPRPSSSPLFSSDKLIHQRKWVEGNKLLCLQTIRSSVRIQYLFEFNNANIYWFDLICFISDLVSSFIQNTNKEFWKVGQYTTIRLINMTNTKSALLNFFFYQSLKDNLILWTTFASKKIDCKICMQDGWNCLKK